MPEQVMKVDCIDSICIGEGEDIWADFLDRFSSGASLDGLAGLWFRRDGEVVRNLPRNDYVDVDSVPMPAYHLLEIEKYFDIDFRPIPDGRSQGDPDIHEPRLPVPVHLLP